MAAWGLLVVIRIIIIALMNGNNIDEKDDLHLPEEEFLFLYDEEDDPVSLEEEFFLLYDEEEEDLL